MRSSPYLGWYFQLYNLVARERIAKDDLDLRIIHAHLTMVFSTGILMWAYTILACLAFSTPVPGIVGIVASLVHLLSPFLYRVSSNAVLVSGVALFSGLVFQSTFAYFSRGVDSFVIAWLPILPLLGGFVEGKKSLIIWTLITGLCIAVFYGLHFQGYTYPDLITEHGYHWAQLLMLFGWLFIVLSVTWIHVSMKDFSEGTLKDQGRKIDDLFRVLFHDLANSLGRINIGMSVCGRDENPPQTRRGLQIIQDAQLSMTDITQNVRRMYAVSKGKAEVDLSLSPLNPAIENILTIFASEIERKNIQVIYDREKNQNLSLMVEPVSFSNQVLGNIFSNAIKFSDSGGTITISAWPVNHQMVTIEIKDNGIGMPQVLAEALFDMNKRTTRPGTKGESGTGFGMHIMKSFVEMYKGQVIVETVDREKDPEKSGTSIRLILKGEWI